jgi:hypothetical protein
VQSQLRPNLVKFNPPVDYYAEPVDGYATDAVQGEPLNPLWHCDVCNREMQLRSKQAHLKTKGHKEKLKEQEQEQNPKTPKPQNPRTILLIFNSKQIYLSRLIHGAIVSDHESTLLEVLVNFLDRFT